MVPITSTGIYTAAIGKSGILRPNGGFYWTISPARTKTTIWLRTAHSRYSIIHNHCATRFLADVVCPASENGDNSPVKICCFVDGIDRPRAEHRSTIDQLAAITDEGEIMRLATTL